VPFGTSLGAVECGLKISTHVVERDSRNG
jgi:hypothetical protein